MNASTPQVRPRDATALGELLRARLGRVRLLGSGSRQARLPRVPGALVVDLSGIATIDRLDAPDQTCSVDCGVTRAQLDDALRPHGLELPCAGEGTLGGLFASDPIGALTHGGHAPRTLLLGMQALLADGTPFQSGARVVKSVAGFDVHRLLVGSEGRLFVATRLHLRLKPVPRARAGFEVTGLDRDGALAKVRQLRELAHGLEALQLVRGAGGYRVRGALAGRASFVAALQRSLALPEADARALPELPATSGERLAGIVLPSALPRLLATLPAEAPFLWHGGGRFEVSLQDAAATDRVLAALPSVGCHARLVLGPNADRIGLGTPIDAGQRRTAERIEQALDPHDVLC